MPPNWLLFPTTLRDFVRIWAFLLAVILAVSAVSAAGLFLAVKLLRALLALAW